MIEHRSRKLSVRRQCKLVGLTRSSLYRKAQLKSAKNLPLMRLMDALHLENPAYGARLLMKMLRRMGHAVTRKRVSRLMKVMGLEAMSPKPSLSKPNLAHRIYPYLLKNLRIDRPNQVWATDITYVPIEGSYVYLCAIMDWHSRRVLAWEISNTLDTNFCVMALKAALAKYGPPEIFNTDQGSQFTSEAFTDVLLEAGVRISMDGKGRCMDNIFVERLWRTVKYEEVYRWKNRSMRELYERLKSYFIRYNDQRPHSSLDDYTPSEIYFNALPSKLAC